MFLEFMHKETVIGAQNSLGILFFALEIVIKWAFRNTGIFDNGIDSRWKKTILREQFKPASDQVITGICIGTLCFINGKE